MINRCVTGEQAEMDKDEIDREFSNWHVNGWKYPS
jgi:hypothetical protein